MMALSNNEQRTTSNAAVDAYCDRTASAFGHALKGLLKRLRQIHGPYAKHQQAWTEVAGAQVSEHARVVGFREGVLEIAVDNPMWRAELQGFMAADLVRRLRADPRTADVVSLRFRLVTAADVAEAVESSKPKRRRKERRP